MKTKKTSKKAVSLIVLVITIIVMVILAGAIVLTLNNSGIIERANDAVEATNLATVKEIAQVKWAEAYLSTDKTQEKLEEYVLAELAKEGITTEDYTITVTTSGIEVALNNGESVSNVIATVDGVPIPKGFVASSATGENTKNGGLVIYEGTEAVTDENVEEAKRSRNQYVWVPVDTATFDTTFVRKNFGLGHAISNTLGTNSAYWEVTPTTELNDANLQYMTKETLAEVQVMYESVEKYGGFYIARYEAGIDAQRTAEGTSGAELPGIKTGTKVYSVMGKIPYTYIPWTWDGAMNEDRNGAVEVARGLYPENNTNYGVVSTLTYGVQWDRTLAWWLETEAKDIKGNTIDATASVTYGNYSNHDIKVGELNSGAKYAVYSTTSYTLGNYQDVAYDSNGSSTSTKTSAWWALSTGALKAAKVNNIYDMAGNMYEWTMEGSSTDSRVYRGGYFYHSGSYNPVAHRYYNFPDIRKQHLRVPSFTLHKVALATCGDSILNFV